MAKYQSPRGTSDLYGQEIKKWHVIEEKIREISKRYGLSEIRTPEFEHTEVFARENDSSDVVNKEMYTFNDSGGRSLTLKPEGTAGLIRAYVQHKLYNNPEPLQKFYYLTPAFRYERPQKGRTRIHHQFGVELIGQKNPFVDVQAILIGLHLIDSLGISEYNLHLNTLGDDESRNNYRDTLRTYFKPYLPQLCVDCQRRYEQNPMRIIDCKVDRDHPAIQEAPSMRDSLNESSLAYFKSVTQLLDTLEIPYIIDDKIVRGLDYYTDTVFEVISTHKDMGSQSTIFAGGRFDNLVSDLGGPDTSSFGFGMGIERLLVTLEAEGIDLLKDDSIDVYGISLGEQTTSRMLEIVEDLRSKGYSVEMDYFNRSLKAQFKSADRFKPKYILILGEDELQSNTIRIKNTTTQIQEDINQDELLSTLQKGTL